MDARTRTSLEAFECDSKNATYAYADEIKETKEIQTANSGANVQEAYVHFMSASIVATFLTPWQGWTSFGFGVGDLAGYKIDLFAFHLNGLEFLLVYVSRSPGGDFSFVMHDQLNLVLDYTL